MHKYHIVCSAVWQNDSKMYMNSSLRNVTPYIFIIIIDGLELCSYVCKKHFIIKYSLKCFLGE